MVEGADGKAPF